jgi:hypothetical protein
VISRTASLSGAKFSELIAQPNSGRHPEGAGGLGKEGWSLAKSTI